MPIQGTRWRTSSYTGNGGNCVEVARPTADVLVRDTKDRTGGTLALAPTAWHDLLTTLR